MDRVQYDSYGGPEVMYIARYALLPLEPHQVRVRVKAAAINSLDWKLRRGVMRLFRDRRFPKTMGCDFAGVVEAVGDAVTNVGVGDDVFGTQDFRAPAAFAQTIVAESRLIAKMPPRLSFSEAACLPIPAATAWVAIMDKAEARAGSSIFIHGCVGAVGALAVQLALAKGVCVAGTCSQASVASARAAGVAPLFTYDQESAFLGSGSYDAVFDAVGTLRVSDGLSMLKKTGVFIDSSPTPSRARVIPSTRYRPVIAAMGTKDLPLIAEVAGGGTLRPRIGLEAPFGHALAVIANAEVGPIIRGRAVLTL